MKRTRFARTAAAAVMAGLLIAPTSALAASKLTVSGTDYLAENGAASGEGWTWDGADDMGLDGYNGGRITAEGDLIVTLTGENTITYTETTPLPYGEGGGLRINNGDLTITGEDGSLEVNCDVVGWGTGIEVENGNLTIEDTTVSVDVQHSSAENGGGNRGAIYASDDMNKEPEEYGGNITISNSTVNARYEYTGDDEIVNYYGINTDLGALEISNSRVVVEAAASNVDPNADLYYIGLTAGDITITHSDVDVAAMPRGQVMSAYSWHGFAGGVITIDGGSEVVSPEGTSIGADNYSQFLVIEDPEKGTIDRFPNVSIRIPDEETVEVTRTITYVFEDGSEAAPSVSETRSFTHSGVRDPFTDEPIWGDWESEASSFGDIASPEIEGYEASIVAVAGESVTGESADLTYEVVYTKKAVEPEPEPEPKPAPVKPAAIPATSDPATVAPGIVAALGSALSALGLALKKRR